MDQQDMPAAASVIQFTVHASKTAGSGLARRGTLRLPVPSTSTIAPAPMEQATPSLIFQSRLAFLPHLTPAHVALLHEPPCICVALEHLLASDVKPQRELPDGLHRSFGYDETKHAILLSAREPGSTASLATNPADHLTLQTPRGVRKHTLRDYARDVIAKRPSIYLLPSDDPSHLDPSIKRTRSAIARTQSYFEQLASLDDLRPILGNAFFQLGGNRSQSLRKLATHSFLECVDERKLSVGGIAVPLLPLRRGDDPTRKSYSQATVRQTNMMPTHTVASDSVRADTEVEELVQLVNASLNGTSERLPRMLLNPEGPHEILCLIIETGSDLFLDDWASRMASLGVALDFDFPAPANLTEAAVGLNLFDDEYSLAFTPLSHSSLGQDDGRTTRAYVHHLLHTHEMTAHVLLSLHNLSVMQCFMANVRHAIETGTLLSEAQSFSRAYSASYDFVIKAEAGFDAVHKVRGKGRDRAGK
ncbi:uncharacterized protein L969DRAFT_46087 [Mixia osmundae IAM 14324]|uniref:tRNA-guanine(15) transglycosylase-like domain-containing protein n=1 Tax=Mixia osmundae (strain CBS 9802 / IAM 14324 / JCM 22182 / KY 12970) TaxID=764103 RepID=G7E654_MIXOS|nr:uncharacterized protein L969DRAFT_46087 [Mixia osmundae IAM 14324]KEI40532.1 hypothetical protein L969DRAFT_46087 [Mixia osmundae IAM 14324]GAA98314.1 hypothetical protein E5Q_04999 [Mixia osmundae IAM 14324]